MSKNKSGTTPKRPGKLPLVLMSILTAVTLIVGIVAAVLVPKNFDMINSFFAAGPSGEEVDTARQASANMTQEVESEGIVLLENKKGAKDFSDVAVFVISRFGGEGADLPMDMTPSESEGGSANAAATKIGVQGGDAGKHYLELQQVEQEVLDMVKENFGTVIVLVNSTNAMELGWLEDSGIDAALWVGCLGSTGANAVGEVLSGAVNPSGRTADTFAYEVESAPSYYSIGAYDYTNVQYTNTNPIGGGGDPDQYHYVDYIEGIYVGYRYYETAAEDGFIDYDSTVQYPFGYGLSYTSFKQEIASFSDFGDTITMEVSVSNTGSAAGKTVVQVYYTAPYTPGGIEKSHVVLADFTKTDILEPGKSQTVTLSFAKEDMASYDYRTENCYVLDAGTYTISVRKNAHELYGENCTYDFDVNVNMIYKADNPQGEQRSRRQLHPRRFPRLLPQGSHRRRSYRL